MPTPLATAEKQTYLLRFHIEELNESLNSAAYKTFEVESAAQSLLSFEDTDPRLLDAVRKAREARELLQRIQSLFA